MRRISEVQFCVIFSALTFLSIDFLITIVLVFLSSISFSLSHPSLFAFVINLFLIILGFSLSFHIVCNFQFPLCLGFFCLVATI